jgi:hypothetical protein
LLRCVSILLITVCCSVCSGKADAATVTSLPQSATWVAPHDIGPIYPADWATLVDSAEGLEIIGCESTGSTLARYSLVEYEIAYISPLEGSPPISATSPVIFQIGATTTRPATASEGSTLTMLLISALCIALILLRRRRRGMNSSQGPNSSASSAREGHLTNSYEAHSPMTPTDASSRPACRQDSMRPEGSCFRT